jgi:RHS repeat-associated protein
MALTQHTGKLLMLILMVTSIVTTNAQNINKPNKMGPMGTQVNTQTGNLFISRNDIYIPARGFDILIGFNYNSFNYEENNGFGNGWSLNYCIKYKNDTANSKTISWGDGREDNYKALFGGGFQSPKGFFNILTQYQPDKYLLTGSNGSKFYFDNSTHKKITRMEEPNGNFINFNYTDTLLTSLVNTAGQSISFTYDGSGNLATVVDAITAPTRTYTYSYDGNKNLTKVTDPLGGTNKYSYLINGPMKTMADKNNNSIDIIYFNDFSVSEIIGCNKRVSFSYDTATNITIATDHLTTGSNQVTKYGYKKSGDQVWLTSISGNCCGYNLSFEFDDNGNKIKETDANGNVYNYTYDARGNMLTMKDPMNQTSAYTYSSNYNQVTSFTDPKGNISVITYDANGNLTQLTEPGSIIYTAAYNSNGDIVSSTDPKGNIYSYSYDTYGNPVSVSGPNGYHATLANDARGNLLSLTDARNNTHTAEYDILNRLKKIIDPATNARQFNYDGEGNVISTSNKNNEKSLLNYDASNRIVKYTDALGHQTEISYDGMDNIIAAKNALGNTISFSYDNRNRLNNFKNTLNNSSNISYDANGNITSINLPNGQQLTYTYDNINRVTGINDINGTLGSFTYDKNNNITSFTNGTGAVVTAVYDDLNRITKISDPLGLSTQFSYDQNNNVVSVTDRNAVVIHYTYDSLNRVKTYTDKNGFVISVGYDVAGNATQVKDQNNNITLYSYDILNRLETTTYPDGKYIQYGYDKKSNIISKRLTDGTTINFQYDTLNRIITKTLPGGQLFTYGYDALGRVISATNSNGTVGITYDALNRISSETFDGRITRYNYDIAGRTQTTIYPDSTVVIKKYDARNRLSNIAKNNTTLVSYQYNNANQVTVKNFANGVSSNLQYDFANRLSSIYTAGGNIQNTSFTYDNERNKNSINRLNDPALSEQFTYDNGHRLTQYKRGVIGGTPTFQNTYSFDAVGNRTIANLNGTNTTYTTNNLNQLTNSNNGNQNINFIYDNNGNLTYDGIFYKTYDAEGRLLKDSSTPVNVLSYLYDAFNRRVQKNFNGIPYKYAYSGLAQIEERDGNTNNITGKTIFTSFLSPVMNEKNGNSFFYHQNELNSVEAISNSSGNLTERYQYDVYGKPTIYDWSNNTIPSSLAGNRFAYTGQEYDSANGNYRFHFRNYSPSTGTFNQRDLIGYSDGMGMYQYVDNNPANGVDIFGLKDCPPENETIHGLSKGSTLAGGTMVTLSTSLTAMWKYSSVVITSETKRALDFTISSTRAQLVRPLAIVAGAAELYNGWDDLNMAQKADIESDILLNVYDIVTEGYEAAELAGHMGISTLTGDALLAAGGEGAGALIAEANPYIIGYVALNTISKLAFKKTIAEDLMVVATDPIMKGYEDVYNDLNDLSQHNHWVEQGKFEKYLQVKRKMQDREQWYKNNHPNNPIKPDCPQNGTPGGTEKPNPKGSNPGTLDSTQAVAPKDPNEIIGPNGQPTKHWVSVKDRLPYTILFENDTTASAPAKFVRVTSPIEPKQDAATFQLGNFGFNNQTFVVPPNTASYYQRLDCKDSLGLYVDITAGYDQINHVAFWEFQSIDPITLLSPSDPLKGFLLLQDSTQTNYGHGLVNFSIKPLQSAITLDTIGARATIMFDTNDTIPTNIAMNTIDAFAPTSHMNPITANSNNTATLSWGGIDDAGGCGLKFYTLYVSKDGVNFNIIRSGITRTDTSFIGASNATFYFFVLATDSVGNTEILRPGEVVSIYFGAGPLPVTWLYFKGVTQGKNNLLEWATADEQNSKEFKIERSVNGTTFNTIGLVAATGNSNLPGNYQYKDYNIDRLNSAVMFYRLKQFDKNGVHHYSNIIRLSYSEKEISRSMVYPNPTAGLITITIGDQALIGTRAGLYDENGRLLESIKISAVSQTINLSKYVNGTYFIKLSKKDVLKLVKM